MYFYFKRCFDVAGALLLLLLALPLLLLVVPLLAWVNKGKVWFVQPRPGRRNKVFLLLKLRTMNERRDVAGVLLPDAVRLTRLGKLLRSTSIDELPQLVNVLKGDMSLVGPRPLLVRYLDHYTPEQARRHEVRPGITGWAQVNGRNTIGWEEKFALDVYYVDHCSLLLDLRIIWRTLVRVLRRDGISHATAATMPAFVNPK